MDIPSALHSVAFLSGLPDEALAQLVPFCSIRTIRRGETIFCQGEPSPYCFGILSGEIVIQRVARDRNHPGKVLSILEPGTLFGEASLFHETFRAAMASAHTDGQLLAIRGVKLREWIGQNPAAGNTLLMSILHSVVDRLEQTSQNLSLIDGVARLLIHLEGWPKPAEHALAFIQNAVPDAEDVALYRFDEASRSLEAVAVRSRIPEPIALKGDAVFAAFGRDRAARTLHWSSDRDMLTSLGNFSERLACVVLAPLVAPEKEHPMARGILLIGSEKPCAFSVNFLVSLEAISRHFSHALAHFASSAIYRASEDENSLVSPPITPG
ncbi:MAG TPA: cyclic nucleotide-binding domain-containing protein [Elusimicrobiota bacterium]|nr:cyclic nucleotide-binding domain-containing protein [Elusimicrobiota bacterium]